MSARTLINLQLLETYLINTVREKIFEHEKENVMRILALMSRKNLCFHPCDYYYVRKQTFNPKHLK